MNTSALPQRLPAPRRRQTLDGLSGDEIRQIFQLAPRIEEGLRYAKGSVHRVALFFHAVYLETFGKAPPYAPIPEAVARHIAGVLGETIPDRKSVV